jgi:KaiC/GvpD/RAD55 family RecA-like ATPase
MPVNSRDLVQTGIKGLDELFAGGIPRGNIILLAGAAGTGKTTLGVEVIYRGAREHEEPGLIVLFEVALDKAIQDAAQFGWDLPALESAGKLRIIFTTRQVFQQEMQQADSLLLAEAAQIVPGASSSTVSDRSLPGPTGGRIPATPSTFSWKAFTART